MVNAKEISEYIAATNNISKAAASEIVKGVFAYIREEIATGNSVRVDKFGTFSVEQKAERNGRNPATGEALVIPAKNVVKFKSAADLKAQVNQ